MSGPRNGMFINNTGNKRDGEAFLIVKRHGREFHIYGTGEDRSVYEVGRARDAGTDGGTTTSGTTEPPARRAPPGRPAPPGTTGTHVDHLIALRLAMLPAMTQRFPQRPFVPPEDATEIVMIRHGASAAAVADEPFPLIGGHADPPLAPEGRRAGRGRRGAPRGRALRGRLRHAPAAHRRDGGAAVRADRHRARRGRGPARGAPRRTGGRRVPHPLGPGRPAHPAGLHRAAVGHHPGRRADARARVGGSAAGSRRSSTRSARARSRRRSSTAASSASSAGRRRAAARSRSSTSTTRRSRGSSSSRAGAGCCAPSTTRRTSSSRSRVSLRAPDATASRRPRGGEMAAAKTIEIIGRSTTGSDDAVRQALDEARRTVRNITGVDVVSKGLRGDDLRSGARWCASRSSSTATSARRERAAVGRRGGGGAAPGGARGVATPGGPRPRSSRWSECSRGTPPTSSKPNMPSRACSPRAWSFRGSTRSCSRRSAVRSGGTWPRPGSAGADDVMACTATWSAPGVDGAAFSAHTLRLRLTRGDGLPGRVWRDRPCGARARPRRRPRLPAGRAGPHRGPAMRGVLPDPQRARRHRGGRAVRPRAGPVGSRAARDAREPRPPDRPGDRAGAGGAGAARQHRPQDGDPRRRLRLRHHDGRRRPRRRGQPRDRADLRLSRRADGRPRPRRPDRPRAAARAAPPRRASATSRRATAGWSTTGRARGPARGRHAVPGRDRDHAARARRPAAVHRLRPRRHGPPARRRGAARAGVEQAALRRVATLVASEGDPADVFSAVTEEVGRLLGAHRRTWSATSRATRRPSSAAGARAGTPAVEVGRARAARRRDGVGRVWRTGRPVRVDSYDGVPGTLAERSARSASAVAWPRRSCSRAGCGAR